MTLRLDGRTVWVDGRRYEADDVVTADGEIAPGMVHHTRKVGFNRGVYEVAVIWSTGTYSSNASGLAAATHGRTAVPEFTDEPEHVEVAVGREGRLLRLRTVDDEEALTAAFVPAAQGGIL